MTSDRENLMTEIRSEVLLEGTKGLLLINGGGAVALASWLQVVWDKPWAAPMLWWHVSAMVAFAVGIIFAAVVHIARYLGSLHKNTTTPRSNPWWWTFVLATMLSILCFAIASGLIAAGSFKALPMVSDVPSKKADTSTKGATPSPTVGSDARKEPN